MNRRYMMQGSILGLASLGCEKEEQMNRNFVLKDGALYTRKGQLLGTVAESAPNVRITAPVTALASELPFAGYTVTIRQREPTPDSTQPSYFGALAKVSWGVTGSRNSCVVDCFPYAVVPFLGDGFSVELGWDPVPTGLTVPSPDPVKIEISIGFGLLPMQATRTFRANNPHPLGTPFRTNAPPYASHVRVFTLLTGYVAATVTDLEAPLPVIIDQILGNALQPLNRDGGIRLPQVVQSVNTTNAGANLSQLAHSYTIGGAAGRS